MAVAYAPDFERLERLSGTQDADLTRRSLSSPHLTRGRGAQTNATSRFERHQREAFDDGWQDPQGGQDPDNLSTINLKRPKTTQHIERAKSIITRNKSPDINFDRSINPYRGCEHGCSYCYARPTHTYLGLSAGLDFEREIYTKVNSAEVLRHELSSARYKAKPIALGTSTDPYQPMEREARVTRGILEVLLETKHPVLITTKSALVVRDLDILSALAEHNLVSVGIGLTSMDHQLSNKLEPRASTPARRLETMRLLSEAGVPVMAMAAPMIPAINDMELERLLDAAAAQGVKHASMIPLRLPGEVRDIFRQWLLRHYPDKLRHVMSLVRDMRGGRDNDPRFGTRMQGEGPYAVLLKQRFDKACDRYGLNSKPVHLRNDLFEPYRVPEPQLSLF